MTNTSSARASTPVRLDHATLRGQEAGSHTRYTVSLRGRPDDGWLEAYRAVCEESSTHQSFPLDRRSRTISFSCLNVEGPTLVFDMLERLEALLVLVERRYEAWHSQESSAAPRLNGRPAIAP